MPKNSGPIFILGFPRSGTTALARAIGTVDGISEFSSESHFFYFWAQGIRRVLKGKVNQASFVAKPENRQIYLEELRKFFENVYVRALGADGRWVDKTPGIHQAQSVDVIRRVFPDACFLFTYRTPEEAVRSNIAQWPQQLNSAEAHVDIAKRWAICHRIWRKKRERLKAGRYVEIFQPQMRDEPESLTEALAEALGVSLDEAAKATSFLADNRRVNRPKGGDRAAAYDAVELSKKQLKDITDLTREEQAHWPKLQQV